jgi:magnesium-transporting ATPase (P-type)
LQLQSVEQGAFVSDLVHPSKLSEENWHSFETQKVFEELDSSQEGLQDEQAARRLDFYGRNSLPVKEPPTIWEVLLHQILNPLIFILIAAAVASLVIGEVADAVFIFLVIALNSGLGAYQEYNAERSAASLQSMLKIKAKVRRGGRERVVPSEEVVPGDVVLLESGVKVPADLRLVDVQGLAADESFLTGESIAAEKSDEVLDEDTVVSDRSNIAFAGSTITSGRGLGVAVATGAATQVGVISESVTESEGGKPPLVSRMEKFVRNIGIIFLVLSVGLAAVLKAQGYDAAEIFFFVIAMAVSAIPEGLPVALTVALSIATKRMSRRNVIVRKLTSVESLGSCTVIASDKTGTLTVNQQTARMIAFPDGPTYSVSGQGYNGEGEVSGDDEGEVSETAKEQLELIARQAILANEGSLTKDDGEWDHSGDAMDVAFLAMGYKLGLNPEEVRQETNVTGEIPYESELAFSAAFYEQENQKRVAVKGAVEKVLEFCSRMYHEGGVTDLDREGVEKQALSMADKGLRVLAVASGETELTQADKKDKTAGLSGLVFQGLVGFIDPLRAESADAVRECREAGIKVIMITGDHPATAGAIARELDLGDSDEKVVTGSDLREAGAPDSPAYEKLVASTHVFARVAPAQKLDIVDVLQRQGEFVAVTGDGVNDAPALKKANIGVAMGSGTDVAKEVGAMIVTDDNFASIVAGVEEGRFAYDNVRKVIYLLISTGAAEILMFLAAIAIGVPLPLLAVQILWLNLVTNGIQDVALAFEGGEPGAMKRKPRRPGEGIFDTQMVSQTVVSGLTIGAVAFAFWYWMINVEGIAEPEARNSLLLLMVLLQNVHVFNCRSESTSAFKVPLRRNYLLVLGVIAAQGIHLLSMHIPVMERILGTDTVPVKQWFALFALALSVLVVMEIFKLIKGRMDART